MTPAPLHMVIHFSLWPLVPPLFACFLLGLAVIIYTYVQYGNK